MVPRSGGKASKDGAGVVMAGNFRCNDGLVLCAELLKKVQQKKIYRIDLGTRESTNDSTRRTFRWLPALVVSQKCNCDNSQLGLTSAVLESQSSVVEC
jgi:hypothetical protein